MKPKEEINVTDFDYDVSPNRQQASTKSLFDLGASTSL